MGKSKQSNLSVFLDSESISFQRSILFHNNVLQYPSVVRPDQACRGSFPAHRPQSSGSKIFSVGLFYYRAQGPTLHSWFIQSTVDFALQKTGNRQNESFEAPSPVGWAMKIKKKKCLQVNIYFVLSFRQQQVIPFWKGEKYQYFATIFFQVENVIFWGVLGRKTGRAGPITLKLSTKRNQVF